MNPQWIWLKDKGQPARKVYFRKEFAVRGVAAARLYATCDNAMTVYLDGKKILTHSDSGSILFKDITSAINRDAPGGKQVLTVEAESSGSNNPAGLLLKLDLESGWRDAWSVTSDATWQATTQPAKGWRLRQFKPVNWRKTEVVAQLGHAPWVQITAATLTAAAPLKEPTATPIEMLKVAKDFKVELLYSVPKKQQGSWVNMCIDPKGRLIVSDQYGGLFRVTLPPLDSDKEIQLEKINVDIGEAQGLLWAFDSLYVVVNRGSKYASGLYRVRDTNGDDKLDSLETLRILDGRGEHGPHAILLTPDKKSLYVVCGEGTKLTEFSHSRVPQVWDEDNLLPRTYGRGFMKGVRGPGGYVARIDPDGANWELVATGFRNQFDAALNAQGDLFTFDADMEWDVNTPWYRPTRVCHVVSGAEFGWRNGAGKWPVYYPDSLPPVVDIGPGSPTGICFGYNAKFPAKFQRALFISDWSYGKLFAVHMTPSGATYKAKFEEFITGTPLPLTDVIINPHDGAMYFAIGGRRVQSGLYRVTYTGAESTVSVHDHNHNHGHDHGSEARALRRKLESRHVGEHADTVNVAWPNLKHEDRFVRFAARIAIEHRPLGEWQDRALAAKNPQESLTALLALVRQFPRQNKGKEPDIDTPAPKFPASDVRHPIQAHVLTALNQLKWKSLSVAQRIELMRVYTLTFLRLGAPDESTRKSLIAKFDAVFPARARELNSELAQMMVYLQAPWVAGQCSNTRRANRLCKVATAST